MSEITVEQVKELAPKADTDYVERMVAVLNASWDAFDITTPLRVAHFMAQICHESAGFTKFEENLNYSASRLEDVWPKLEGRGAELEHNPEALANAAYAGRYGNGDEASGAGWKYHGRGPIMTTFYANYEELGYESCPEKLANPEEGTDAALRFWKSRDCNAPADVDDVTGVTKKINGGTNGLEDRKELTAAAKQIWGA